MFKRNQVMITALAIMIAVAGYLNFAGTKVGEEELADVGASAGQESDMEALLELSDEDGKEDIASLDSDTEDVAAENFLNENMQTISDQDVAALTDAAAAPATPKGPTRTRSSTMFITLVATMTLSGVLESPQPMTHSLLRS